MQCLKCGNENSADAKFCRGCGNKLEETEPIAASSFVKCSKCGHANETSRKFCPKCGTALITTTPIPSPSAPDNPPSEIEPKIVLPAKAEAEETERLEIHADEKRAASLEEQEGLAEAGRAKFELWRDRVWGNSEKKLLTVIGAVVAILIPVLLFTMKKDIAPPKQQFATSAPTGASASQPKSICPSAATGVYTNPFAYCKAVVDQDGGEGGVEDSRYVGTNPPAVVVNAMMNKFPNIRGPYTWRCMDGDVYGCYMGASGRACAKRDTSQRQLSAIGQFCANNPNAIVPNSLNYSSSEWRCNGTIPIVVKSWPVDKRGYLKDSWVMVSPYNPPVQARPKPIVQAAPQPTEQAMPQPTGGGGQGGGHGGKR